MNQKHCLLSSVILALSCSVSISAQTEQVFTDPSNRFTLKLQGEWRAVSYQDAVGRSKTEFVYRDRSEGLLRIAKESLGGRKASDFVREEEETSRVYKGGFEITVKEPFGGGALSGMRLSYHYLEGGRKLTASYYFLEQGDTLWILRFTGKRGSLDTIRNLTDQLARSFRPL